MKHICPAALLLLACACSPHGATPARQQNSQCFENGIISAERFAMQPSRRFKGVWHWGFETSVFEEEGRPDPAEDNLRVWLEVANPEKFPLGNPPIAQHYAIEFIGRESVCDRDALPPGMGFGHFSASERLIVADQILSLKPVDPKPSRSP